MRLLITTQVVDIHDPILGFFHDWILEFSTRFDRIDVICLKEGVHTFPAHVHVHSLGKEKGKGRFTYTIRFFIYFFRFFIFSHTDFVLYHMGAVYNILGAPFFFLRKIRRTSFYWWKTHGHINIWGRIAGKLVDRVYTASDGSFPLPYTHKYVVGHGISITNHDGMSGGISEPLSIIVVGRISPAKHVEIAIASAQLLREKGIAFKMQFVGAAVDPEYMRTMEALVQEYTLSETVAFIGTMDHGALTHAYTKCDFLLHPSTTGGIDKVVLEAMQNGVFPIALTATYAQLIPSHCCVPSLDPAEFVGAIERVRRLTDTERKIMREEMRATVIQNHSLATLTTRIFGDMTE